MNKKVTQYDHKKIESRIQKEWAKKKVYKTGTKAGAKKHYVLDMFPYPSGVGLHVGHPRGYIASDVYARQKRMQGYNVLHPMGFDSFGLPAEQYAINTGKHPGPFTDTLVKQYRKQLEIMGFSFDWDREVATHQPEYYKWTQWIFLKLYDSWYDMFAGGKQSSQKNKNTLKLANSAIASFENFGKAKPISELIKMFEKNGNAEVNAWTGSTVPKFSAQEWKGMSPKEQSDMLMNYRIAYEGYSEVNWCPELGTVLANDEIIDGPNGPVSERGEYPVEKKLMRQWFMRITAYAGRLLRDLDGLDWNEHIKEIQRNWIGESEGSEIDFKLKIKNSSEQKITVFTTRADTLFGATYVVLAPENPLISTLESQISNIGEVRKYISDTKKKTDEDRTNANKEKTGVELKGVKAINPANGEEISVWVADYVLAGYGTGAVMAVPAHDERDWEFAKKYKLPIKEVIEPLYQKTGDKDRVRLDLPFKKRTAVVAIIKHWSEDKYLCLRWKKTDWRGFVIGGIEPGEDMIQAAEREIKEETGYQSAQFVKEIEGVIHAQFYHAVKEENRWAHFHGLYFELQNGDLKEIDDTEKAIHEVVWIPKDEVDAALGWVMDMRLMWQRVFDRRACTQTGILTQSGVFNGMASEEAKKEITKFVGGRMVTRYKMRDAIFARQRYWGEPIPLINKKDGTIAEVKTLPLKLPNVKSYQPSGTGESPLSTVKDWVAKGYETNTMPGWAGSSWYFLRYMDPKNRKEFASKKALKYWKDVDMYVGGQEHATGHLLYSRFWHKFLYDMGYVPTSEPFRALRNQGMILGPDNRKMSKRWGNVVNPDDIVKNYGADTLRVYESFIGPFDQMAAWNTDSIMGPRRFLERAWRAQVKVATKIPKESVGKYKEFESLLHKTIQKVTEDIATFGFNTAISSLMILLNSIDELQEVKKEDYMIFLQLLAPFAPHMTEELWREMKGKGSIHHSKWPTVDKKKIKISQITIGVQVNGKVRSEITLAPDAKEEDVKQMVLMDSKLKPWIEGKEIKKFIYISGKIINIVI